QGLRPTYTDLIVKALALALCDHPLLNAEFSEEGIRLLEHRHIGVAVAVEGGLLVPVVRDADVLTLREIAAETNRLAGLARAGLVL
ncbi:MAG: 2-oxo acid dehydrogenase subunit E2, partial [Dehalococcoidia bacterium]|nr:2-oxo acid dehydrogenase subunit E2 [Dehalococcoidia bacterium]